MIETVGWCTGGGQDYIEQINGPSADIGALINSTVAVDAQLIGAIGGALWGVP